jgi:hypothetical protein
VPANSDATNLGGNLRHFHLLAGIAWTANKAELQRILAESGAHLAVAHYSGRDEEAEPGVFSFYESCEHHAVVDLTQMVEWKEPASTTSAAASTADHLAVREITLREALDEVLDKVIPDGYANGDGGGGKVVFDVDSGELHLDHYENVVHQVPRERCTF